MPLRLGDHSPKLTDLRELRTARGRRDRRAFAVEGPTLLAEALAAGRRPDELYFADGFPEPQDSRLAEIPTYTISARALARCSDLETPPGAIAVFPMPESECDLFGDGEPVLALGVSDPGNAGTLVRTAEIFGITRIVFAEGAVDPYAPKVIRATMGATFRTRTVRLSGEELVRQADAAGYTIFGATGSGEDLETIAFPSKALIAIGSERAGLDGWLPRYDRGVAVPQVGVGDSLNAAVAGGIVLYTFSRRRRDVVSCSP